MTRPRREAYGSNDEARIMDRNVDGTNTPFGQRVVVTRDPPLTGRRPSGRPGSPGRHPRLSVALLACAIVGTMALPLAATVRGASSSGASSEHELIALTNRSRAAAGLKALKVSVTLTAVARWRSADMVKRDYFSHAIPGYGSVFKKLDATGYCYRVAGENIGWNDYPADVATAAIHKIFMDSSGHRANILARRWDAIGVGMATGPDGKRMWTVLFADVCRSAPKATIKPTRAPEPKPAPTRHLTPKATPKPKVHAAKAATRAPAPIKLRKVDRSPLVWPANRCRDPRATTGSCEVVAGRAIERATSARSDPRSALQAHRPSIGSRLGRVTTEHRRELGPRRHAKLRVHAIQVEADRAVREVELLTDLPVR
jgi:uncharacterized protein YkwD